MRPRKFPAAANLAILVVVWSCALLGIKKSSLVDPSVPILLGVVAVWAGIILLCVAPAFRSSNP